MGKDMGEKQQKIRGWMTFVGMSPVMIRDKKTGELKPKTYEPGYAKNAKWDDPFEHNRKETN